ncbi:ABC transporter ATP-binding protein [Weissella cibaria]|nr:ABC transporter ATP-binding protein [Weissella cibaria]
MVKPIIDMQGLTVTVPSKQGTMVPILNGVNLTIMPNQVLGLVGESGSGKTMTMRTILGLLPKGATATADVWQLAGENSPVGQHQQLRMAMVFQDPLTGLNPVRTIGFHLTEVVKRVHPHYSRLQQQAAAEQALEKVNIPRPTQRLKQYPHELSGGLRQRVLIAMALLAEPDVLIADEPTTALDVTVQAQILTLLKELQRTEALTIIFITHDLGVISAVADNVAVMRDGQIVEAGTSADIFQQAQHPYTQALLAAVTAVTDGHASSLQTVPHTDRQQHEEIWLSATHRVLGGVPDGQ